VKTPPISAVPASYITAVREWLRLWQLGAFVTDQDMPTVRDCWHAGMSAHNAAQEIAR
jgi:hypothetical protein